MAEDKIRVHIFVYQDDWDKMGILFGGNVGRSKAARDILHNYLTRITAKAQRVEKPMELSDDDFANLSARLASSPDQSGQPE